MPRIFVSSRFAELQPLRQVVEDKLNALDGYEPVLLDDHRAHPLTPRDRSLGAVAECDCLVLLLGSTYSDSDGVSLTELEYREAREQEMPVLAFSRPNGEVKDVRARSFLEMVQEDLVVGGLTSTHQTQVVWDAERVVRDVRQHLVVGDEPDSGLGPLRQDVQYLGISRLPDHARADDGLSPRRREALDYRDKAVRLIRTGATKEAGVACASSYETDFADWVACYLYARSLELAGGRSRLEQAVKVARHAEAEVGHVVGEPPREDRQRSKKSPGLLTWREVDERRKVATYLLISRLRRQLSDSEGAVSAAEKAVKAMPHSTEAHAELLAAHADCGGVKESSEVASKFFAIYPDDALRSVAAIADESTRNRVDVFLADQIAERIRAAERELGALPFAGARTESESTSIYVRLCAGQKLTEYRLKAAAASEFLTDRLRALAESAPGNAPDPLTAAETNARNSAAVLERAEAECRATVQGTVDAACRAGCPDVDSDAIAAWLERARQARRHDEESLTAALEDGAPWLFSVPARLTAIAKAVGAMLGVFGLLVMTIKAIVSTPAGVGTALIWMGVAAAACVVMVDFIQRSRKRALDERRADLRQRQDASREYGRMLEGLSQWLSRLYSQKEEVRNAKSTLNVRQESEVVARERLNNAAQAGGFRPGSRKEIGDQVEELVRRHVAAFSAYPRWAFEDVRSEYARRGRQRRYRQTDDQQEWAVGRFVLRERAEKAEPAWRYSFWAGELDFDLIGVEQTIQKWIARSHD